MRDTLLMGAIVGLCALAGGAAGSYLAASQLSRTATTTAVRSAEVALARLQADPSLRRHA